MSTPDAPTPSAATAPAPTGNGTADRIVPKRVRQVAEAARALGLDLDVREFPEGTRTAADAAAAIGVDVDQIVKSLVFVTEGDETGGTAVLVPTSGGHRVDPAKVAAAFDVPSVRKADAAEVRDATGYAIGGVAPFGFPARLPTLVDRHLTAFDQVWAAAGTHAHVFPLATADLLRVTGGRVADVTED